MKATTKTYHKEPYDLVYSLHWLHTCAAFALYFVQRKSNDRQDKQKPFARALNDPMKASLEYQSSLRRSPNLPTIYWSESIENVDVINAFDGQR